MICQDVLKEIWRQWWMVTIHMITNDIWFHCCRTWSNMLMSYLNVKLDLQFLTGVRLYYFYYIYICIYVCVCVYVCIYIYIYIYTQGAGHIIKISSKSWFISLIPFKNWNLYNVYIYSTQTDIFQVFISFNFDDYNWQLMKPQIQYLRKLEYYLRPIQRKDF